MSAMKALAVEWVAAAIPPTIRPASSSHSEPATAITR
jgi:hypothetical protein